MIFWIMTTLCLNPNCLAENPENQKFCSKCSSKLLLENRYRAVKYLGRGGFGTTFLAVDQQRLNSYCVIKQFLPIRQKFITSEKDIKPENIIRRQDGSLVLIDFGISQQLTETVLSDFVSMSVMARSRDYAPPEQFRGRIHYTSDLYSLALTAIRLLTGFIPIIHDELYDIYSHTWKWQEWLQNFNITVNQNLAKILNKMLENNIY